MPPKQSITEEMIVEAAFRLVRKKGIAALSARAVANSLGCSTQPVYSCFRTMKDLENKVVEKAAGFVLDQYLVSKVRQDNNFKSIGVGYLTLAKKDKHLFDLLYVSGRVRLDFENHVFPLDTELLLEVMRRDPHLADLSEADLLWLLCHMWIYTHGLTVLASTNPAVSDKFALKALDEMGHLIVMSKVPHCLGDGLKSDQCPKKEKGVVNHENMCN